MQVDEVSPRTSQTAHIAERGRALIEHRLRQLRKLTRLLPSRGFRRGLLHGVAASLENLQLMRGVMPATLIDVGANRGQFSLLVRTLHPGARIYAFEPLSRPAVKFESLFHGDAQTTLHRCAIGPQTIDRTIMYVSKEDDGSSLLPHAETVTTESVADSRLDEILQASEIVRSALLKLDVQGYELLALQGCGHLLDVVDFIYVEVSFMTYYHGQALADENKVATACTPSASGPAVASHPCRTLRPTVAGSG